MKKVLVVVDMQNDFIDGSLGTKEAVGIVENVVNKIKKYQEEGNLIITTQDTHYENYFETQEGKKLPIKHCLANTDGWQINDDVYAQLKKDKTTRFLLKHTFGSVEMINILKEVIPCNEDEQQEFSIEIIGLCFDICVISNAILVKNFFPEVSLKIDTQCTAATSEKMFNLTKVLMNSLQIGDNFE